ncbi:MAG: hypothetical protein ABSG83_05415 [Roseiarcus sp.]|jgi:hypothetical protein
MPNKRDEDPAPAPDTKAIREAQSARRESGQPYATEAEDYGGPSAPPPDRHRKPPDEKRERR